VAELITQEEKLLEEVASLKRSVPAKAAAAYTDMLREGLKQDEEAVAEMRKKAESAAVVVSGGGEQSSAMLLQGVTPLERQGNVEKEFTGAVEVLAKLKTDMSAMLAKMERARVAGEYVVAEGR
jgi:kinetochor protein Mis14/NSL1